MVVLRLNRAAVDNRTPYGSVRKRFHTLLRVGTSFNVY